MIPSGSADTDLDALVEGVAGLRTGSLHFETVVIVCTLTTRTRPVPAGQGDGGAYLACVRPRGRCCKLWGVPVILSEVMTESTGKWSPA